MRILFLLLLSSLSLYTHAQDTTALTDDTTEMPGVVSSAYQPGQDSLLLRGYINALCARGLAGRGYVNRGMYKTAQYLTAQFGETGLRFFGTSYSQPYSYSVNTFPGIVDVKISDRTLKGGEEYLVYPTSGSCYVEELKLVTVDGYDFARKLQGKTEKPGAKEKAWQKWYKTLGKTKNAYLLRHMDTVGKLMGWNDRAELLAHLPAGVFLLPQSGKPTWSVARQAIAATVIELYDSSLIFQKNRKVSAIVQSKQVDKFAAINIMGYVPGTAQPDSFIVLTAHYDHLGKMGSRVMFPGASDNASGVAMLLTQARYYAAHPQPYSIAFMAFSGEEAGLLGASYYVEHPAFPLSQIRFLLNMDIMGDATNGITVVNGTEHKTAFDLLTQLNAEGKYLPEIKARGTAHNSDHYPFSEKGVPAFFFYTNGGKGYYHDIWDKADQVSLKKVSGLSELIRQFVSGLAAGT
ncbi:M28 family metallopeptidase [Taibaiella koreensis]|uniref:M28 family metallopeptidase n=1 Tax=Taibaiella koreensis TaxID=1268548 RepID=UPI000E59A8BF|nr:M28 family peptidase [Taibaiella koreensis]